MVLSGALFGMQISSLALFDGEAAWLVTNLYPQHVEQMFAVDNDLYTFYVIDFVGRAGNIKAKQPG